MRKTDELQLQNVKLGVGAYHEGTYIFHQKFVCRRQANGDRTKFRGYA